MFRNSEGYPDPTTGEALSNIARQERAEKRAAMKQQERKYLPKIYVCSPFAGDTQRNIEKARRYCAFAVEQGYIPRQPFIFPQFMSDHDPAQRELGLFMGMVYLDGCRECWVFGDTVSSGMAAEIDRAKKRGIVLRYFTEQCEEVSG